MNLQVLSNPWGVGEYKRRADRQHEVPNDRNAQGLFLPSACVFVGK